MAWCDGMRETRVLIGPYTGEAGDAEGHLLSLRHPKSGTPASYVMKNEYLQELHWFKQSYNSWFLGDLVCEDGGIYMTTPIDPIFILLPIFEEARMKRGNDHGMFRELDEILFVDGYPGYRHLLSIAKDSMELVCEVKEIGSSKFFRLDDSKVLAWLCCKAHRTRSGVRIRSEEPRCSLEKSVFLA
uniref:Ribonuclease H2 subunit B n=1 Tax=Anthurium amnicola TaxID=1678845 RepID=A0A1D1YJ70_9ARAE